MTRARRLLAEPVRRFFASNAPRRRPRNRLKHSWAAERIEGLEDRTLLSAATITTVTPSATALTYGQTETLTATVSSQAGIPNAGTVTFFDSTTPLGTVPVSNGTAQLATATFTAGLHALTATYSGDGANFAGSSSTLGPNSVIQTVAGTGSVGYSGDGGLATSAELNVPYGIAVDSHGNLFIADLFNSVVREVNATTHVISTVAGTGTAGYNGDGILATTAQLNTPVGVAVDSSGNIFIADDTETESGR